ncbi:MAG: SulP family inorganic anion transporter [Terriglobales bacterium]
MTESAVASAPEHNLTQAKPHSHGSSSSGGDFWGGLAAMLVALPSAIAFGVTIFAPLGTSFAAQGAIAGILGTTALGVVAATFGGTKRLITAPCAPAVAVLSAFAIGMTQRGISAPEILLMMALIAVLCGVLQIGFGLIGLGRLIKYMPYPVVSGYLTGVGLIIIISQVPRFLGAPRDTEFWQALLSPSLWKWQSAVVGAVTVAAMLLAPKITKTVPAAIVSLLSGMLAYVVMAYADPSLRVLAGNKLIIGPLASSKIGFLDTMFAGWRSIGAFHMDQLNLVIYPALTLAVLLSIDTLKTCVVLDTLTHSRHNSNRELIGQGLGNLASLAVGGVPGSGQMGATLVNLSSGGQTRMSGVIEGVLALVAFLALGKLIVWVPIAALAGILIVVGVRMFDRYSLALLRSKSTILDFAVIVTVVVVAETVSLIAASGVGVGLAIMLFLREQSTGRVVRRKSYGDQRFSKQMRTLAEREVLRREGGRTVIFELQGSLFFGTTDQLYTELEPDLKKCSYVVLDMRRVQQVDVTAAHMLELIEDIIAERNGVVIFSHMPSHAPSGQDMVGYFKQVGLTHKEHHARVFPHLDAALEWVEDRILATAHLEREQEKPWEIRDLDVIRQRKDETIAALEASIQTRSFRAGDKIFSTGDPGDELYLIRRGSVRILMPLAGREAHHLATYGRGAFFGELAFVDRARRSADAVAYTDVELYVLTRERFDALTAEHHKLALNLMEWIATVIAARLRETDAEMQYLKES